MSMPSANADLSVSVSGPRMALVLDPLLCLSPAGPQLIARLQARAELWMVRELWHILDNSEFYRLHPHTLFDPLAAEPGETDLALARQVWQRIRADGHDNEVLDRVEPGTHAGVVDALQVWERLRANADLAGLKLFWVGDGLQESLLPEHTMPALAWRHDCLAGELDWHFQPIAPIACAQRDAVALAAALGTMVLTQMEGAEPELARRLRVEWGVPASRVDSEPLAAFERTALQELLASCRVSPLVWAGTQPAILHLHLPAATRLLPGLPSEHGFSADDLSGRAPDAGYWHGAQAFWYPL